jgi:hypothetical protein
MNVQVANVSGCLLPPWPCCFQRTYAVFPKTPSPTPREKSGFILLEAVLRLQSMWPIRSCLHPERCRHLPWNFFPYRDKSTADSSNESELPTTHLSSALSVSHTLDGLLPAEPDGLISFRTPRVGFTLQGLSLLPSRIPSSGTRALITFIDLRLSHTEVNDAGSGRRASRALIWAAIRDH